jgi:hypothetical protein
MDLQERVTFDRRARGERKAENLGIGESGPKLPLLLTTILAHAARGRKRRETLYLLQR